MRRELEKEFRLLGASEVADEKTLVLRLALVSVQSPPRELNVVTTAVIFVPVASGSATFEGKLLDGATGEVLAEIREKRSGGLDAKSLTIGAYSKFVHAEAAFKKWAGELPKFLREEKETGR